MDEHGDARPPGRDRGDLIEVLSTVLLAIATVATAWSGYQASRWSGEQAIAFSAASAARVESGKAATEAGQLRQVDLALFTQWLNAYATGESELADFYAKRFRAEFQPAFDAWVATRPRTNPDAPLSPFAMDEYRVGASAESERLVRAAEASTEVAKLDNQRSDNYVLCLVLFAAALFFAGISTKVGSLASRSAILALGYAVFVGTVIWILTFPVSISV